MNTIATTSVPSPSRAAVPADGRPGLGTLLMILAALALALAFALQAPDTPAPAGERSPATGFAAARAMASLRQIAARPHPVGSADNKRVREYLVGELRALGLAPAVQTELGVMASAHASVGGYVHNVVARLPGKVPGKALMLVAHYDSVPSGNGAADNGASVAAILETVRALAASGPLRNDLIVLFTDGEEAGLLGAEAFVSSHPWKKDVAVALNFEFRGNTGPMLMFETSSGNGKLVEAFAGLRQPVGSSLMYEVYKLLPNDTDMSALKRAGLNGMNFAAIERPSVYHSQLDRIELLDESTLQHEGETMLALARHFGDADLGQVRASDRVYFNVPGLGMITYGTGLVLPLAGLVALLSCALLVLGMRRGVLRRGAVIAAAILFPIVAVLLAIGIAAAWGGITVLHPVYALLFEPYNSGWYAVAMAASACGLATLVQGGLRRWISPAEQAMGAVLVWLVLLVLTAIAMPGASYLFTWPLLPLLLAQGYLLSARGRAMGPDRRAWLLAAAALPGVLLIGSLVHILFVALTLKMAGIAVLVMLLFLGLLAPLLSLLQRRWVWPALPLVLALGCLAAGSATSSASPQRPVPNSLTYIRDGMSGKAFWVSSTPELDGWLKSVLGPGAQRGAIPALFGDDPRGYWSAPAPASDIEAPRLNVLSDTSEGEVRTVRMHLGSPRLAPLLRVHVEGVDVLGARLQGKIISSTRQKVWVMSAYGLPQEGAELVLQVSAGRPFKLRMIDRTYGLPRLGQGERAPDMIMQPSGASDSVQAVRVVAFD